jgi:hypothetical protein
VSTLRSAFAGANNCLACAITASGSGCIPFSAVMMLSSSVLSAGAEAGCCGNKSLMPLMSSNMSGGAFFSASEADNVSRSLAVFSHISTNFGSKAPDLARMLLTKADWSRSPEFSVASVFPVAPDLPHVAQ